uniref:Chemokine interleukin-8-like domain-containing protein n=1 Tax=Astatotilapia calliptera TaxID=8154 RepID=A0AAX7TIN9_ASTCA
MNSVTAFIACLLILGAQGQPASKSNKCKCYSYIGRISPKLIKAEPVIHYPSIFCPHTEIIVTTKADMKRQGRNGAVKITTAGQSTAAI